MAQYRGVLLVLLWFFLFGWMGVCALPGAVPTEGSVLHSGNTGNRVEGLGFDSDTEPIQVTRVWLYAEESDLQRLFRRDPRSDDRISGFVRFDSPRGRARALNGFRFRGNTSRYHPRKSYNIRFTRPRSELSGSDRLNLNAMYTDPSGMREKLAWEMFARLEYPAPEARYMALYINEGYEGLGIHVQRVDEVLLRRNGLSATGTLVRDMTRRRGELFEIERRSAFGLDLAQFDDVPSLLAGLFDTRGSADWQELARLIRWVHDTPPGEAFDRGFQERFDAERFIDWLALHYLTGDVDAFGDDYWLYRPSGRDGRWILIPWDKDITFGHNEREGLQPEPELGREGAGLVQLNDYFAYEYALDDAGWGNELITRFLQTPALRVRLFDRMLELMDEVFTPEWVSGQLARQREAITPYMPPVAAQSTDGRAFRYHTRQHHGAEGYLDDHIAAVLDFVELRQAFIRREIARQTRAADASAEVVHEASAVSIYEATIQVQGAERLLLTDDHGWSLASLQPVQPVEPCIFRMESKPLNLDGSGDEGREQSNALRRGSELLAHPGADQYMPGITRRWFIYTDCAPFEAVLSLYYRNDIAPDGKENWYTQQLATGRQRELLLAVQRPGEELLIHPTSVNPYSNKATARVEVKGEAQLLLVLPR